MRTAFRYACVTAAVCSASALQTRVLARRRPAVTEPPPVSNLVCWGYGQFGALGLGDTTDRALPTNVKHSDLGNAVKTASHGCSDMSAAVTEEGNLFTWGKGTDGRLGHGFSVRGAPEPVPRLVTSLQNRVADVALGEFHGVCLTTDGRVWSWGKSKGFARYLLGHDNKAPGFPAEVHGLDGHRIGKIACGRNHTAVLTSSGTVMTWGCNDDGALGHGDRTSASRPKVVEILTDQVVVDVACGKSHSLFLTQDGHVYSCGFDTYGQLGHGTSSTRRVTTPTLVQGLEAHKIESIHAGANFSVAVGRDGAVYAWGLGTDGQLGHGELANVSVPKQVDALSMQPITSVACGDGHMLLMTKEGQLLSCGRGRNGQLGLEDSLGSIAAYHSTPVPVHFFDGKCIRSFACGANHSLAVERTN